MAEYTMNYETLEQYIDDCILNSNEINLNNQYKASILAALSVSSSGESTEEIKETITMWQNQIDEGYSQVLFGNRFLSIQSAVLGLVKLIIEKGLLRKIIQEKFLNQPAGDISVEDVCDVLKTIIARVKKLDGTDICIAYQVVKNMNNTGAFRVEDINRLLPLEDNPVCNLMEEVAHEECDYYNPEDNICTILSRGKVEDAVKSLLKKEILKDKPEDTYCLRW